MVAIRKMTPLRDTHSDPDSDEAAHSLDHLEAQGPMSKGQGDFAEFIASFTIVDQLIEREFKSFVTSRHGMSPGEVRILMALRRAGPDQLLRPTDLFKSLLVTSGAVTKQLDRLESRGFVRRVVNEKSKRGWLVVLTASGRNATDRILGRTSMPIAKGIFSSLSPTQRAEILRMLHSVVRYIQEHTRDNPID